MPKEAAMVTLVIRTKESAPRACARASVIDRFARWFYDTRLQRAIREIEGKPSARRAWL
jgi:hypothetical protein